MELFSPNTLKQLTDKNADKRNQGAKEVEECVKVAISSRNDLQIKKIIEFFKCWIQDQNSQKKRSGMLAFQAIASVLIKEREEKLASKFVVDLTQPVLESMEDRDDKVRIAAVECLYTLSRILKELMLINITEIIEKMIMRAADHDEHVKKILHQLDHTLRLTVMESGADKRYFDMDKFIPMLQARMKSKTILLGNMLISWIKCLHSILTIDMFIYLPRLLEDLFMMLVDQPKEIRLSTDTIIGDFFKEIESFTKRQATKDQEKKVTEQIIDILIKICSKGNTLARLTAVLWIFEYLRIYQSQIEDQSYISTNKMNILQQNLTGNSQVQISNVGKLQIKDNESSLKNTIITKIPQILKPILTLLSNEEEEIRRAAQKTNDLLLKIMDKVKNNSIDFMDVVSTVQDMLQQKNSTAESALVWINHLLRIYSEKMMPQIDNILSRLIEKLNDAEGTVLQNVMEVLGSISSNEKYFDLVIDRILCVFHNNKEILTKRSELIIKKLCSLLNPEKVYGAICSKLVAQAFDVDFIAQVIQTMDFILVTDHDLQDLRQVLRNLRYEESNIKENVNTFEIMFLTFSYNPVSAITLCFLAEEYELAYNIIISLSAEVEIDMDTLIAIAKLVNILESAIFVYMRLQLLEHDGHPFILKCLQGLMMILPQGVAFTKLKQRLKNIKSNDNHKTDFFDRIVVVQLEQKKLLTQFRQIRQKVHEFKRELETKDCYS